MEAGTWSQDRIESVLSRVGHKLVLSTVDDDHDIPNLVSLQQIRQAITDTETAEHDRYRGPQSSEDIAYVIFTSGTTGLPKGVEIAHHSLLHYVQQGDLDRPFNLGVTASDTMLLLFSVAFDGGESSSPELIKKWWTPSRKLWNIYGPTEATVAVTIAELRPDLPVTLGRTIKDSTVLLLDSKMEESSEGEICIAGANLAVGYYKDEEQTAEKFIQWKCQRIYRTGDLAKRTKSGLIFCGRKDQMVKNRGFLINIEAEVVPSLLAQPGILSAAAIMHRKRLIAFISPSELDSQSILRVLSENYDQFLVPDEIVLMQQLPQTSNGKVDNRALTDVLVAREQESSEKMTLTPEMNLIRDTIADVIGVPAQFVDLERSFREVGGNSLLAIKLLSSMRQKGILIPFQSLFLLPKLSGMIDLLHVGPQEQSHKTEDGQQAQQSHAPMTDVQKGIIRSTIREPPAGYIVVSISLHIPITQRYASQLSDAWRSVLSSHSIFRALFDPVNGLLEIGSEYEHHWKTISADGQDVEGIVSRESSLLLVLARSKVSGKVFQPVTEFSLIVGQEKDSVLLLLVHHSLIDGHSIGSIIQDVRSQLTGGRLTEKAQFSSYCRALPTHLDEVRQAAKHFWTEAMAELEDGTQLRICQPDSGGDGEFGEESLSLGMSVSQVDAAAKSVRSSSAVVMYSAWALLLCNYACKNQVVFGGVFSGRNLPVANIEQIVGPLINTCPLPIRIPTSGNKIDLLSHVQALLLGIVEYQWSASELLPDIAPGSQAKIFDTVVFLEFDLGGFDKHPQDTLPAWTYRRTDVPEFGFTLNIQDIGGQLVFRALYDKSRYGSTMVSRMLQHFRNLSLGLMHPNTGTISQVYDYMLEPGEFLRLISGTSSLHTPYFGPSNLKDAFELAVQQWPDGIATEAPERNLTYAQLNRVAAHVAKSIADACSPRSVVALLGDGSLNWLIGALAICKADAVYLPLDTKLPVERMRIMVKTAGASLCLYPNEACYNDFSSIDVQKLLLHELVARLSDASKEIALPTATQSDDYAYIMFTSGSTGTPKGIRVTHRAVLSHLSVAPARMHARPGRRHAQIFSPGFDVNIAEIFGTLCYGATLVLKDVGDPFAHLHRVNATMITPSFLSVLSPDDLENLDTIYLIGEAVPQSLSDRWSPGRTLYNFYGPCECTIAALYTRLQHGQPVTLGGPVPRVGVYILDAHNRPVPVGVMGEICLSGIQVMEGYIGEGTEAITKRVFAADPFNHKKRMYRTGDVGVWTESGEVRFVGRVDNQVKVQGYRIELEEIEQVIRFADTAVTQSAAVVSQETIYAFVAPDTVDVDHISDAIRYKLPSYALPQHILTLPSLPTTLNQKLDRKALSAMIRSEPRKQSRPFTKTEKLIGSAWRDALGLPDSCLLSSDDDFLALGGNSLRQIVAAQKLCAEIGLRIPLSIFIRNTQMSTLAKAVDSYCQLQEASAKRQPFLEFLKVNKAAYTELSFVEKELYKMHSESSTPSSFNVAHEIQLSGMLDLDQLEQAIQTVVSRNDILQTNFELKGNVPQRKKRNDAFNVVRCESPANDIVNEHINSPFDLASDQLSRIVLIEDSSRSTTILLVQHHIVTDQVAARIFLNEIGKVYASLSSGDEADVSPKTASYASWAQWKNADILSTLASESRSFWKSQFGTPPPSPFLKDVVQSSLHHAAHASFTVSTPQSCRSSLEVFLAVTAIALQRVFGTKDLSVGIPFVDRTEPGTAEIMGVFLDRLPVRVQIDDSMTASVASIASSMQSAIKSALTHALPYFQIRDITGLNSLFDIMLVYNRSEDRVNRDLKLPGVTSSVTPRRASGAKFPLLIEFTESDEGIVCELEYFEDVVSSEDIGRICDQICNVLESA
ncbi:hypothetical protein NW762_011978 [Fusarium torreyae]|uniref:Carrier domain-containing protein n=1 Tax=Fusarium torreyae TaxID=1237075 RepID=A0A9W8RS40_9HYPO|nr:hypothetical protein NW762_011978 [Fusarium torreyae]